MERQRNQNNINNFEKESEKKQSTHFQDLLCSYCVAQDYVLLAEGKAHRPMK